ncbi:unnamed protein product [Nippostrongylus brasiliensis]|uniref:CW domain-containing protein n=1 Tax=Nippostrongylus brasiliensis TaxID=27835 RepID=A0A0N4Y2T9_NIPBR|nr:unnamed protein product [Nippostrongylus brasiliensis]
MQSVVKSLLLFTWTSTLTLRGAKALSFAEIEAQSFTGVLKFEYRTQDIAECQKNCYWFSDCTIAVHNTNVCSLYGAGNGVIQKNGNAYEIRRDAVYNNCEPKLTFPTLVPFIRTHESDGTTTAKGCTIFEVIVYVNTQGIHFYMDKNMFASMLNITPKCEIHFVKDELPGCSSIPVYSVRRRRRMLFGSGYAASDAYQKLGPFTSSANCAANAPKCKRDVILREYKNTAMEDYLYLPEGAVHPQLQYTEVDIPIHSGAALSFVENQAQDFTGRLKYAFKCQDLKNCLANCYYFSDCTTITYSNSFCSIYGAGNDVFPTNGQAYEIRRDAVYNKCEPKFTLGTLVPFTRTPEADGTTTATGCTLYNVKVFVNPQGVHFFVETTAQSIPNLTKKCEIHFVKEELPGCSSIPVVAITRRRRLLFGNDYLASAAYTKSKAYTSSANCVTSAPECARNVILREYKNTTMEDYIYLPPGIVHPQLQYSEVDIPIHVQYTDCSAASI